MGESGARCMVSRLRQYATRTNSIDSKAFTLSTWLVTLTIAMWALWARPTTPSDDVRMLVGVPQSQWQAATQPLRTAGLLPWTCHVLLGAQEVPLCSAGWGVEKSAFEFTERHATRLDDYDKQLAIDRLLLDVSLAATADIPRIAEGLRYTALWHHGGSQTAQEVHGLDPAAHLSRCRELAAQGFRPACVAVADTAKMITASVWHRAVVPEAAREAPMQLRPYCTSGKPMKSGPSYNIVPIRAAAPCWSSGWAFLGSTLKPSYCGWKPSPTYRPDGH